MTTYQDYEEHADRPSVARAHRELITRIFERRRRPGKPSASIYEAGDDLVEAVTICVAVANWRRLIRVVVNCLAAVEIERGSAVTVAVEQRDDQATADQLRAYRAKGFTVFPDNPRPGYRTLVMACVGRKTHRLVSVEWTKVVVSASNLTPYIQPWPARTPTIVITRKKDDERTAADCVDEFFEGLSSWVA